MNMFAVTKLQYFNSKETKKDHKCESEEDAAEDMADEKMEEDPSAPLVTHVNNILHSIFSHAEVYINSQKIYNSKILYAHTSYISNNFKEAIS